MKNKIKELTVNQSSLWSNLEKVKVLLQEKGLSNSLSAMTFLENMIRYEMGKIHHNEPGNKTHEQTKQDDLSQ